MASLPKRLGAAAGSGTLATGANLYTASGTAGTSTVISTLAVCNAGTTTRHYRVCISTASTTFQTGSYIVFEAEVAPNDTHFITNGLTLDPSARYLVVSSDHADVNFSAFGTENS